MGSAVSVGTSPVNGCEPLGFTFDQFMVLKSKYETIRSRNIDDSSILKELLVTLDEEIASKSKEFIEACGKFVKGGRGQNIDKARRLYKTGLVNVNAVDEDGWSALFHAAGEGHIKIVKFLLEECHGVTVDLLAPDKCTPLWIACYNNRRDVVEQLLLAGADETVKAQPEGEPVQTPALAARRNRHPGLADLIDTEHELRQQDQGRRALQTNREMTLETFRASMRTACKPTQQIEG